MKREHLIDVAHQILPAEDILSVGLFQPAGAIEGMSAGLAAGTAGQIAGVGGWASMSALAAGQVAARVDDVPRWTLVAVAPERVSLIGVRSVVAYVTISHPALFAQLERAELSVATHRFAALTILSLLDSTTGRDYQFECSTSHSLGHGDDVVELLVGTQPEHQLEVVPTATP